MALSHADVFGVVRIHDNDTTVPVATFFFSPDREDERLREHSKGFSGFFQAEAYVGYEAPHDHEGIGAP